MICNLCSQEMTDPKTVSCTTNTVVDFPDSSDAPSIPFNSDDPDVRCHDCNVADGGNHHPGCDSEECPKCLGQLFGCGCLDEESDEDDETLDEDLDEEEEYEDEDEDDDFDWFDDESESEEDDEFEDVADADENPE